MENNRKVTIKMIFLTLSYKERTPLFMIKDKALPSTNFVLGDTLDGVIGAMLEVYLGIKYDKAKGSENWVTPKLETAAAGDGEELVLVYSCLIPESYCEAGGEWKTMHDILNNEVEIAEQDRKILYDFSVGGR